MTTKTRRGDRTLRVVMWMDATCSVGIVLLGLVGAPVAASVPLTPAVTLVLAAVTMVLAVALAAFGAVTALVIMARLRRGNYDLPSHLWLPLPDGLRPAMYRRAGARS